MGKDLTIRDFARHEAAHAVVAARLGLPLVSTDVKKVAVSHQIGAFISGGYTAYDDVQIQAWLAALPASNPRERLEALATATAAGMVASQNSGLEMWHSMHESDEAQLVAIARKLGIGNSVSEPAVGQWMDERIQQARQLLERDDGAAWDRVRVTLEAKRFLTAEGVCELIAKSDGQGLRPG